MFFPAWKTKGEWYTTRRTKYPLYNVENIKETLEPVYVVEGEKDVDSLSAVGVSAVTNFGGINRWNQTDWSPLYNKEVIIWPDNDKAGIKGAREIYIHLESNGCKLSIFKCEEKDATEYLEKGNEIRRPTR